MLTHETGTGVERKADRGRKDLEQEPHHEHEEEDLSETSHHTVEGSDEVSPEKANEPHTDSEEAKEERQDIEAQAEGKEGKRKKLELQDQTNLLPVRQVLVVFVGLSMALFCSLLDQTMSVLLM
jgi:hypothetical protein